MLGRGRRPSMPRARTAPFAEGAARDDGIALVAGTSSNDAQLARGLASVDIGESKTGAALAPYSVHARPQLAASRDPFGQYRAPVGTEGSMAGPSSHIGRAAQAYSDERAYGSTAGSGLPGGAPFSETRTTAMPDDAGPGPFRGIAPRKASNAAQSGFLESLNAQASAMGMDGLPRASSSGPGMSNAHRASTKASSSTMPSRRMPSLGVSGFPQGPGSSFGGSSGTTRGDTGSTLSGTTLASSTQGTTGEAGSFREVWFRRLRALMYLKQSLAGISQSATASRSAGSQPWLDTIKLSKRDMEMHDDPERMHKRTARKFMLGCSLAPALDIASPVECARLVVNIMTEIDAMPDGGEREKARVRNFFKSSIRGRRTGGTDLSNSLDAVGIGGPSSLAVSSNGFEFIGAHVPFKLDFWQVIQTLCDILVEIYCKLGTALQSSGGAISREDGMLSTVDASSSNAGLVDAMQKIDVRVKKLFSQLFKEIDTAARRVVRTELAGMDPSLAREFGIADDSVGNTSGAVGAGTAASASGSYNSRGFHGHAADTSA